ncbi:MAG TPA: hypothetical protein VGY96_04110 [Streptosporangiaceae bacterium]|jgi:hypothetical protein|nr:hypothetical protein [Streptosporangiaceae bacterium]
MNDRFITGLDDAGAHLRPATAGRSAPGEIPQLDPLEPNEAIRERRQ